MSFGKGVWLYCKVSESDLALTELVLHDLSIEHYHLDEPFNILLNEDGFQALNSIKYYNLIGRYVISGKNTLVERFTWTTDVSIKSLKNSDRVLPHKDIYVVVSYRTNQIIFAGLGNKLDASRLPSDGKVTVIYINNQGKRPIHTKFSAPALWLRNYYEGQDLSKIAVRVQCSKNVKGKLIRWLNKYRLPAYIDGEEIYIYDVDVAFSAYRKFAYKGFLSYTLTEGPEFGYLLGLRRYVEVFPRAT